MIAAFVDLETEHQGFRVWSRWSSKVLYLLAGVGPRADEGARLARARTLRADAWEKLLQKVRAPDGPLAFLRQNV